MVSMSFGHLYITPEHSRPKILPFLGVYMLYCFYWNSYNVPVFPNYITTDLSNEMLDIWFNVSIGGRELSGPVSTIQKARIVK